MASTPQKDAIVFILDVNPSLWAEVNSVTENKVTMLDRGIHAVTQMIHQKIIDARKTDQIALILFNTDSTDNHLATQSPGEYNHVSIIQPFDTPQLSTIKYLREKLVLGTQAEADIMDALILGSDILMTHTEKKKTFDKKIFLFTDASAASPINTNGLETISTQLIEHQIGLNIILFGEHEGCENEKILNDFCEQVDGSIYEIQEALGLLSQFMSKRVRQVATFRGSLSLARDPFSTSANDSNSNSLDIPIHLFTKTSMQRLPSAKKYSPFTKSSDGAVERNLIYQEYVAVSESNTEGKRPSTTATASTVSTRKDLIKAYRYGRSLIPFHKIDEELMSYKTMKSFHILGFLPANRIDREVFMSGVYSIVAEPGNKAAQLALSALARGLYEKDSVALVRYVRAEGNAPKLGVLQSRIKASYESLLFNVLPFSEDYRRYLFVSFPKKVNETAEQAEAMEEWIASMDLMEAAVDEDGQAMDALRPGDTFNIVMQHHYSALQHRALHPNAPLLQPDPALIGHLNTPKHVLEAAEESFKKLQKLFPLKRPIPKDQKIEEIIPRLWSHVEEEEEIGKKVSNDDDDSKGGKKPQKIDPKNPIEDFRSMITARHEDLVEAALMQMMALIPKFVEEESIQLAFECFVELRRAALEEDEFDLFNSFLKEYKRQAALHSLALWKLLQNQNLTLISMLENAESPITPEEANEFIQTDLSDLHSHHQDHQQ